MRRVLMLVFLLLMTLSLCIWERLAAVAAASSEKPAVVVSGDAGGVGPRFTVISLSPGNGHAGGHTVAVDVFPGTEQMGPDSVAAEDSRGREAEVPDRGSVSDETVVMGEGGVPDSITIVEATTDPSSTMPSYRTEEILVTAARLAATLEKVPAAVSIVGRSEIKERVDRSVVSILEEKEGVNSGSYGSFGALELISLRGSRFGRVATLLDGVPVNNTQNGAVDLYSIPPFLLERIEILRGPLGSLHGGNGVTGVVNFVTAEPEVGEKPVSVVSVCSGSFAYRKYVATFAGRYGHVGTLFGIEEGASNGVGAYKDYSGKNHFGKLSYDFGERGKAALLLSSYSGVVRTIMDAKQTSNSTRLQLTSSMSFDDDSRLEVRAFHSVETTDYTDPVTVSELERYGALVDFYEYGTRVGDVGLGAGFTGNDLSCKDALISWGPTTQDGYILAQDQVTLGRSLKALFSLRADRHSTYGTEISPCACVWHERESGRVWLSFGRGFNPPTLNDLFWPMQSTEWGGWTYITVGNENLKAESSWTVELGSDFSLRNGSIGGGLTGFLSRTKDFVNWTSVVSTPDTTVTYFPLNLERIVVVGLEAGLHLASGGEPVAGVNLTLQEVENETGESLPYMPEVRTNLWFSKGVEVLPEFVVSLALDGTYVSKNLEPMGSSQGPLLVVEGKVSGSIAGFTAYVRLRNMTDEEYPSRFLEAPPTANRDALYYPMPGRHYDMGIVWQLLD